MNQVTVKEEALVIEEAIEGTHLLYVMQIVTPTTKYKKFGILTYKALHKTIQIKLMIFTVVILGDFLPRIYAQWWKFQPARPTL